MELIKQILNKTLFENLPDDNDYNINPRIIYTIKTLLLITHTCF